MLRSIELEGRDWMTPEARHENMHPQVQRAGGQRWEGPRALASNLLAKTVMFRFYKRPSLQKTRWRTNGRHMDSDLHMSAYMCACVPTHVHAHKQTKSKAFKV